MICHARDSFASANRRGDNRASNFFDSCSPFPPGQHLDSRLRGNRMSQRLTKEHENSGTKKSPSVPLFQRGKIIIAPLWQRGVKGRFSDNPYLIFGSMTAAEHVEGFLSYFINKIFTQTSLLFAPILHSILISWIMDINYIGLSESDVQIHFSQEEYHGHCLYRHSGRTICP